MALLVDGNISTVEDLQAHDGGVMEIARLENIDLAKKLKLADDEISLALTAFLLRHKDKIQMKQNGEPDLATVVVTPGLKLWHAFHSITLVYQDAYGSQFNDRYLHKQRHFERQSKKAADSYFITGVGLTWDPILRARAPELLVTAAPLPAATYAVSVAWRNSRGEQGAPSALLIQKLESNQGMGVRALDPPSNAASFDVFVGFSEQDVTRQNASPVAPGDVWVMPPTGLVEGAAPADGQVPDHYIRHERILRRG